MGYSGQTNHMGYAGQAAHMGYGNHGANNMGNTSQGYHHMEHAQASYGQSQYTGGGAAGTQYGGAVGTQYGGATGYGGNEGRGKRKIIICHIYLCKHQNIAMFRVKVNSINFVNQTPSI